MLQSSQLILNFIDLVTSSEQFKSSSFSVHSFSQPPVNSSIPPSEVQTLCSSPFSQTPSPMPFPTCDRVSHTYTTTGTSKLLYISILFLELGRYDRLATSSQPVVPYTHTTGSKLRCQKPTKHTKNICEPPRVISVKHSSVLPDDGSHTI